MIARVKLGEVVTLSQGFAVNAKSKHLMSDSGLPLLRITDLINNTKSQYLTEETAPEKCIAHEEEIIYTRTGQVGLVFRGKNGVVHNNCFKVIPDANKIGPDYLYWFLRQPQIKVHANNIASGSVQKDLNHSAFKSIEIDLLPIEAQSECTKILNQIENKISNNTAMNATLEKIAQRIFKSWFVYFDPVKANEEGVPFDGLSPEIQALFPNEFEESELGMIPKGWEVKSIGDVAEVTKGKSYKSTELKPSQTALVTLKSFQRGGGYRLDGYKEYIGKYKESQVVENGDLIIAYTDMTQAADVIGKPAMITGNDQYEKLVISLDVGVVQPLQKNLKNYLYGLAMTDNFINHTKSFTSGTTVLHLGKDAVPTYKFALPSEELLNKYQQISNSLFEKISLNIIQNSCLTKLRDKLLPRLISGKITIQKAEELLEEAS